MRSRSLVLAAVAAMTACLCCIPAAAEETAVDITEIDITNAVQDIYIGQKPVYTAKLSIVSNHPEGLSLIESSVSESWHDNNGTMKNPMNWAVTSSKYTNGWETFTEGHFYNYGIIYSFRTAEGYKLGSISNVKIFLNGVDISNNIIGSTGPDENDAHLFGSGFTVTTPSHTPVAVAEDTMYRLYNPNSGEHFYTKDSNEKESLVTAGWIYERIGWIAPSASNTPVYRLYNPNAGDHHYTMNWNEKAALVAAGWNDEGIGWYSDDNQTVELYREYNPNAKAGSHNYTTDQNENDFLVKAGWQFEGTAWYALRTQ